MATQGPPPPREGVDLATLLISAIASAAAAYITSKIWAPGTLVSAAFTPVIVALVKEGLRKPTQVITNVVPAVAPSKWTRAGADDPGLVAETEPVEPADPAAPAPIILPTGGMSELKVHSTRGRRLRWRLAVVTGLLGFGIAVLAFTVPELIAGESIGGSHKTTIFGGHHTKKSSKGKTTTSTTSTSTSTQRTTAETTPAETTTVTQTETVTTPQTETTTPSTAAPQSSAAPQSTTAPGTTETP